MGSRRLSSELFWNLLSVLQLIALTRVAHRLLKTSGGVPLESSSPTSCAARAANRTTIILPVLDEEQRIRPCLEALVQIPDACKILVVDGGSRDGTASIARKFVAVDGRVEYIDASPIPEGWNGKAWGLQVGYERTPPDAGWILTVDADVVVRPQVLASMLDRVKRDRLDLLSLATRQRLRGPALSMLHPSMLTTLVYRFGIPGNTFNDVSDVQANGQCFLVRRSVLRAAGGFEVVRTSICEDVTLTRKVVDLGYRAGFCEGGDLVVAEMYTNWRDAWSGWSRSLPMRDRYFGWRGWAGLLEVLLAQGLAVAALLGLTRASIRNNRLTASIAVTTVATRAGVLVGTRRAYSECHWTYWLSPVLDLPVSIRLIVSARRSRYVWRGRDLVRGE